MANRASDDSVHHETSDIDLRTVLGFGLGLLVVGILIHLGVWLLFLYFGGRATGPAGPPNPLVKAQENRLPPEPRLQTNPRQDLRELRASEDAILNSYGWVDQNTGIVRIPIGAAMKLVAERGLPARRETK
jgi:hypothetical protein